MLVLHGLAYSELVFLKGLWVAADSHWISGHIVVMWLTSTKANFLTKEQSKNMWVWVGLSLEFHVVTPLVLLVFSPGGSTSVSVRTSGIPFQARRLLLLAKPLPHLRPWPPGNWLPKTPALSSAFLLTWVNGIYLSSGLPWLPFCLADHPPPSFLAYLIPLQCNNPRCNRRPEHLGYPWICEQKAQRNKGHWMLTIW